MEKTSTWESIAVTGEKGEETVIYANGSGELLNAEMDENGYPDWREVKKPGRGSTVQGVDFDTDGTAYAADTTGKVYEQAIDSEERRSSGNRKGAVSGDGGWTEIGVRNAQVNFHDIDCNDGHLLIAGDDGIIYRFDRFADNWTPLRAGDGTIYSIDQFEGRRAAASADGRIYEPEKMVGWGERPTEVAEDLHGIALGPEFDIAVGAAGTVVERHHGNQAGRGRFEEPEDEDEGSERIAERSRKRRERRQGGAADDAETENESERVAERSRKRRERRRKQRETVLAEKANDAEEAQSEAGETNEEQSGKGDEEKDQEEFW